MTTPINTIPIEDFLNKTRIAIKSNQKTVTLSIKEATDLQNSLAIVMTRLTGNLDVSASANAEVVTIRMDGGTF